MAQKVHFCV